MSPDLSHVTAGRLPRLLIVEKDFSTIEPLIRTCGDRRLNVDFDVCASSRSAAGMLLASSYQLIISGARLTEMEDFFLLKRTQALEPYLPVVVTAEASEKDSASRVLSKGAFDLLTCPLDNEETVSTIRLGLWQGKLRNLIARKEKTLEQYRQHLTDYPDDSEKMEELFKRALTTVEKSIASVEKSIASVAQTMLRIQESTTCFSDFATKVEYHARNRAYERLDRLRT